MRLEWNNLVRLVALGFAAGCLWSPAHGMAQQTALFPLVCESQGFGTETCDVGEPVLAAQITQQQSRTSCSGRVGFTPTGISVVGGCRAAFSLLVTTQRPTFVLGCSSDDFQARTCVAPQAAAQGKPIHAAWVVRRESRAACATGQNFRVVGDSIEVSGGCRAQFFYTVE